MKNTETTTTPATTAHDHHRKIADHLAETLPVQTIAHLTHAGRPVSRLEHDETFQRFTKKLGEETKLNIGYIRGVETAPQPHTHVALVAVKEIPTRAVEDAWRAVSGVAGALATHYDSSIGDGIGYCLKCGDYSFSHNIQLFSSTTTADKLQGRELRTFNRIQQERESK